MERTVIRIFAALGDPYLVIFVKSLYYVKTCLASPSSFSALLFLLETTALGDPYSSRCLFQKKNPFVTTAGGSTLPKTKLGLGSTWFPPPHLLVDWDAEYQERIS